MRCYSLDAARLVFAFFVVIIHIGLPGYYYIEPLTRLSVPFFFMLTGYFVVSNKKHDTYARILNAAKKYIILWAHYFLFIFFILLVLRYLFNDFHYPTREDVLNQIFLYGNCKFFDVIKISGHVYGISTLWYLYGGALSLSILYLLRKYLFSWWFSILVFLLWIGYVFLNIQHGTSLLRIIGVSFPYLYYGAFIHFKRIKDRQNIHIISILTFLSVGLLYIEYFLHTGSGYAKFMIFPTTIFLFLLLLSFSTYNGGGGIKHIPVMVSFDIYIWHRLLDVIIVGVMGIYLYDLDSIFIYTICFLVSYIYRSKIHPFIQKK